METRRFRVGWLVLWVLVLVAPGLAYAFQGTTDEIEVQDGVVGIVDPLIVSKGGTGRASLDAEAVLVGDGTNAVQLESASADGEVLRQAAGVVAFGAIDLADADAVGSSVLALANGGTGLSNAAPTASTFLVGTGAALEYTTALADCDATGEALQYNATTRDFECQTGFATGAAANAVLGVSTNMDLTASSTIHMAPGVSETTQARGATIAPVTMTLDNLNCVASGVVGGTGITITLANGTCGGALSDSATQTCTIGAAASPATCAEAGAGEVITAGDCYSVNAVSTASANAVVVSCNLERTS